MQFRSSFWLGLGPRARLLLSLLVRGFEGLNERDVKALHVDDFVVGADVALYKTVGDLRGVPHNSNSLSLRFPPHGQGNEL